MNLKHNFLALVGKANQMSTWQNDPANGNPKPRPTVAMSRETTGHERVSGGL